VFFNLKKVAFLELILLKMNVNCLFYSLTIHFFTISIIIKTIASPKKNAFKS